MKDHELGKHQYVCPYYKYIPCRIYVCVIVIEIFLLVAGAYILGKGSKKKETNKMGLSTIERTIISFMIVVILLLFITAVIWIYDCMLTAAVT